MLCCAIRFEVNSFKTFYYKLSIEERETSCDVYERMQMWDKTLLADGILLLRIYFYLYLIIVCIYNTQSLEKGNKDKEERAEGWMEWAWNKKERMNSLDFRDSRERRCEFCGWLAGCWWRSCIATSMLVFVCFPWVPSSFPLLNRIGRG